MTRNFTGWHFTILIVGFFSVVIAVNLTMARFAVGTFGGTVVDNSYVASQKFNGWLAQAEQQSKLGWQTGVRLDSARHVLVHVTKDRVALSGFVVVGEAFHPLGQSKPIALEFRPSGAGEMRSARPLPVGRWETALGIRQGTKLFRLHETLQ